MRTYTQTRQNFRCEVASGKISRRDSPNVVALTVGLPVPHETGALLIQELLALGAFQTRRVPLQIRRYPQDPLVVNSAAAADAERAPAF